MSTTERIKYDGPSLQDRAINHLISRGWSFKEVREALGVTQGKIQGARTRCCRTNEYPNWNRETVVKAVRNFLLRENRWPINDDWKEKNDLPSRQSLGWLMRRANWRRTEELFGYTLIQDILSKKKGEEALPAHLMLTIPNVTIRRQAIERYGFKRLIKEKLVQKVNKDEAGILWRLPQIGDEDMMFVEVINATREKNGTFAHYFLRVPPETTTALQAVAWSFGVPTDSEWKNFKIEVAT